MIPTTGTAGKRSASMSLIARKMRARGKDVVQDADRGRRRHAEALFQTIVGAEFLGVRAARALMRGIHGGDLDDELTDVDLRARSQQRRDLENTIIVQGIAFHDVRRNRHDRRRPQPRGI